MVSKKGKLKPPSEKWLPEIEAEAETLGRGVSSMQAGAVVIKPESRLGTLAACIILAAFWNGSLLYILSRQGNLGWLSGDVNWPLTLFMIPPMLMGLGLIGGCLLWMFNPRPTFTLSSGSVPLGGELQLKWEFTGRIGMIRQLTIMLYAKEYAYRTYYSARDKSEKTRTETNMFFEREAFSTQDGRKIPCGEVRIVIPSDLMHSFQADSNGIAWWIEMHGDIEWWPDVREDFKIAVLPAEIEKA